MKKRLLALLLALALVISLMPVGVVAVGETAPAEIIEETAPADTYPEDVAPAPEESGLFSFVEKLFAGEPSHNTKAGYTRCGHGDANITWTAVSKADEMPKTSGYYYLTEDITLAAMVVVSTDENIVLCLNGHKIIGNGRVYRISGGAEVTICDCNEKVGTLIPGTSKGGVAWIGENGEGFYLYDAVIDGTGIAGTGTGGAICMETAPGNILVKDATIKNCTGTFGGAIFFSNGTSVVLENATITGNKAATRGGGVDDQAGNILTVGGNTVITGNYVGKVQQNLNLVNGNRVLNVSTTAPLTQGACIGISTRNERADVTNFAVTTATTQADAHKYFVSDMGHDMTMVDGKVTITAKAHTPGDYKHAHEGVSAWTAASSLPTTTGYYYLTSNVYLTAAVGVASAQNIVLCLNGYNIYQTGEGRIYRLSAGAKLTICDCSAHTDASGNYVAGKITGGNAATAGAFYMDGSGTQLDLYDGIITGNTTNGNGTIVNQNNAVFNMHGGEISGNTATGSGGVLYTNGTFTMTGGTVKNNSSKDATFHITRGTVTLSGGSISGNTVTNTAEAGILTVLAGTTTLSGVTLSDSAAKGVYVNGGTVNMTGGKITGISIADNASAAVVVKSGSFNLSGGEVTGNTSRGVLVAGGAFNLSGTGKVTKTQLTAFDGAGVRVNSGSFTMTGGEISGNNSGTASGAGIRVGGGTASFSGGKITGNTAANGAAVLVAGGEVTMSGTEVSGNTATNNGIIRIDGGTLSITGGNITGNNIQKWGAILSNGGTLSITGGNITGNQAAVNGGGLYIIKGNVTVGGNAVIKNNTVGGKANNIYLPSGQSVALTAFNQGAGVGFSADLTPLYQDGKVLLATNAVQEELLSFVSYDAVTNHTLKVQENALYLIQDPNSKHTPHSQDECGHEDVTWQPWGDLSAMPKTAGHYYLTGNVNASAATAVNTDAQITVCLNGFTVTGSARIYRLSNGANVSICDCKAHTDSEGNYVGGKLIPGSSLKGGVVGLFRDNAADAVPQFTLYSGIIDGTDVINNNTGIAIRMEGHGIVNIAGGEIRNCVNPEGVITMTNGILNMTGGKITGNNAHAIVVTAGTANITGGEISENKADIAPAIYVGSGTVTIGGTALITANSATSASTGAVQQGRDGVLNITGGIIEKNHTRAFYLDGAAATCNFSGGIIRNNTAPVGSDGKPQDGAGVRIVNGTFVMTGGEISGHTTTTSAAGLVIRGGTVDLLGGKITGNTAVNSAGFAMYDGTVTINGTEISGNTATNSGGAVYQLGGHLIVGENGVISGNSAKFGGAVYSIGGDLTINGGTITGNTASQRGGGIDFASDGVLTINGAAKITDNTANEKASNLVLVLGSNFVTEGLDKNAKIGIISNLQKMYADGKLLLGKGVKESELSCFTNDMEGGHTLAVLEDGLYIIQNPETVHVPHAKDECGHEDVSWTAWTDLTTLPTTTGHYYLTGNVELSKTVAVASVQEITLCLNGFDVKQTGEGQRIYRLSGGAKLNLCDCTAHTDSKGNYISGKLTGGNTNVDAGASAIYAAEEGTSLTLYSGKISGNKTEGSGTIVAFKKATFTMYGGEISDNTVGGNGAGVYVSDAHADLLGGVIKNNKAQGEGGGVYLAVATAKLSGIKILNNRAESAAGGLMVAKEAKVEIVSAEISNNQAKNGGGMILQSKGYVNMTGGRISGNKAFGGNGGGVYISRDGTFNFRGGSISGNTSNKTGGGIYCCDKLNIYSGTISGNHAGKEGGGMYITEASWKDGDGKIQYSDAVVNMYGGTISGNTTSVSAAGVLVRGQRGTFNLRGGSITGNKALSKKSGTGHGGGLIAQGKGNFNMYGGSITNNECVQTSGGIGAYSNATVKLYGGTISGNKAWRGAGVYLAGSDDALIDGVTITKNFATDQGAGLYVSEHKVTMNSGVISENEITTSSGAGVCLRAGATMIFNDGEVVRNKAPEGHGGGILIQSDAYLQMNGGLVAENFASLSGGGIRSSRCKVEILGGVIRDNVTDMSGAGVYGENTLIMKNCSVTNNRVTGDKGGNSGGAGIYLAQQTKYTLENVTVSGNYAIGKAGGMQVGYRCSGSITGCTFTSNSASGNAGGIMAYIMCELDLKDTVIEANTAVGNGGGILVDPDTSISITNCAINKNSAKEGGAVHVGAKGAAYITDTEMRNNSALVSGGAIYANGSVYLTDVMIAGSANKDGSAAVVLDNQGADGESYIPSVNQFRGDVIISDNFNGGVQLINNAFINIHGDGLGEKAEILVYQPEGGITENVIGPYHYVRNGDIYTITAGDTSLHVADPVTATEESTEPGDETEVPGTEEGEANNSLLFILGAVAVVALAVIIAVIAVLSKRKKKKA